MAEESAGEGEKKSSKMMIIIILVVLLLAGGGAFYFMSAGGESNTDKKEVAAETFVDNTLYFKIKNPFIIDFSNDSTIKMMQISIALSVDNEETINFLVKHEPMIRNNFLMLIRSNAHEDLYTKIGKEKLRDAMIEEMENIIKKMGGRSRYDIKNLFFTSFVMQ